MISVETFKKLQVPYELLAPTRPFNGVTDGTIVPLGQVRLAVTVGNRHNYRTETLNFEVAHISLPYNAILGYPALAKLMAVTHHMYNMVKMPGRDGTITVQGEVEDAAHSVERAFKELAASYPADEDDDGHLAEIPKKKLLFSSETSALKTPPQGTGGWLHLSRSCSSLLRVEHIVAAQLRAPAVATASPNLSGWVRMPF